MRRLGPWMAVAALLTCPAVGYAEELGGAKWTLSLTPEYTPSSWTKEAGYANRALAKLGFGVKNLLLGWTEILTEPKHAIDKGSNFFIGVGTGLKNGIGQELGGAVHLTTFFITELDAPLPEGGTRLL